MRDVERDVTKAGVCGSVHAVRPGRFGHWEL
jgi:hypothetical protein